MSTLLVALSVIVLPVAIGLVVARTLTTDARISEDDWIDAPFLGIATIILPLQNAVLAGWPIRWTAWPLLAAIAILAVWIGRRRSFRCVWSPWLAALLVIGVAVYAINGLGLWIAGAAAYTGRGWGDQVNYASIAHYLAERPWNAPTSVFEPAALLGFQYSRLRIGQSVLHAFFDTILGAGIKPLFEPTILLSPLLVTVAVFAHGVRAQAPRWLSLLLAAVAGLLPAIAAIHLESFFSQALGLPFLLYLPIVLERAVTTSRPGDWVRATLLAGGLSSIYFEFLPLLLAAVLTFALVSLWLPRRGRTLLGLLVVAGAPLIFRITSGLDSLIGHVGTPVLPNIYPWALTAEGVERLLAGDLVTPWTTDDWTTARAIARAAAFVVIGFGYVGLLAQVNEQLRSAMADRRRWPVVGRAVCLAGFATVPLVLLLLDEPYPYQFYKMLTSSTPLLIWGAGIGLWQTIGWLGPKLRASILVVSAAPLLCFAVAGTAYMAVISTRTGDDVPESIQPRQTTNLTLTPGFLAVQQKLRATSGRDVVLCASDTSWNRGHVNAWLALLANRNRVWLLNPRMNDHDFSTMAGREAERLFTESPQRPLLLATTERGGIFEPLTLDSSPRFLVIEGRSYLVANPGAEPFVMACHPAARGGMTNAATLDTLPDGEALRVYANADEGAVLTFRPKTADLELMAESRGRPLPLTQRPGGTVIIPLDLRRGVTPVRIRRPGAGTNALLNVQLLPARAGLVVSEIDNPNGIELVDGRQFFWIGRGTTSIELLSPAAGQGVLELETILGPSLQATARRRLEVRTSSGASVPVETTGGPISIPITLTAGWQRVAITSLDRADTFSARDPRPLLLGVRNLHARAVAPERRPADRTR